jgi:uncharacterized membrane protein HdeD (DUF308 family)
MTNMPDQNEASIATELAGIRRNWAWFLTLGAVQIIAGAWAAASATSARTDSALTLGVLLLIAGAAQTVAALLAREWDGFLLFLLLGTVYNVAGLITVFEPLPARLGLPPLIAAAFLIVGFHRIAAAMVGRVPRWRWEILNGLFTMLMGIAIWRRWPYPGLASVSVLVGCELIANGTTWSVMAVSVRRRHS